MPGLTLTISATAEIVGGDGGLGGLNGENERASGGAGGAGVGGINLTIINSGSISGGLSADGTRANAVTFGAGDNVYEHRAGSSVTGNVVGDGDDLLRLGGNTDGTFDLASIGSTYRGFGSFEKTGNSTFTLGGTTTQLTPWTISDGVLEILSAGALGADTGLLTFNNPDTALEFTAVLRSYDNLNTARDIRFLGNGAIDMTSGTTATLSGNFTGGGRFIKTGRGSVILNGDGSGRTGTTYLDDGTLTIGRSNALGSGDLIVDTGTTLVLNDAVTIANNVLLSNDPSSSSSTATFQQSSGNATIAGVISGSSANISKTGSGNLTFSGANTYQGTTTVAEGTLTVTTNDGLGTADGGTIVQDGATLAFDGPSITIGDAISVAGSGANGAGALRVESGSTTLGGLVTLTGDTAIFLQTGELLLSEIAGDHNLTLTGGTGGASARFSSDLGIGTGNLTLNNIDVGMDAANSFTGDVFLNSSGLDLAANGADTINDLARVTLARTGIPAAKLTLYQDETIGSLAGDGYVGAGGGDWTLTVGGDNTSTIFEGLFLGSLALVKTGTGTLTLTRTAGFQDPPATGGLTIRGGTVAIRSDEVLGADSAALTFDGAGTTLQTLASVTSARNIALNTGGIFNTDAGTTATFAGIVSGSGGLTKAGAGTLVLTGANTYTGGTALDAGTIRIGGNDALGTNGLTAADGTTLDFADGIAIRNNIVTNGLLTLNQSSGSASHSGALTGPGGIIKTGDGSLTLSGNQLYAGVTRVAEGTLIANSDFSLGTIAGNTIVENGATLDLQGVETSEAITISGAGVNGAGALRNSNSFATVNGRVTLASDATIGSGPSTLQLKGGIDGNHDLTINAQAITYISSDLAIGGNLTINGTGIVVLERDNSFTGDVTVSGGRLTSGADDGSVYDTIGDTAALTLGAGTSWRLAQSGETIGSLAGNGDVYIDGFLTTGRIARLTVGGNNASTTFGGRLREQSIGVLSLTKTGTGTLTLTGNNTYSGGTLISGGRLSLGSSSALGTGQVQAANDTGLILADGITLANAIQLTGDASGAVAFGGGSGAATISGIISGAAGLLKLDAGTLVLTGTNTYSGGTQILEGTIAIGSDAALGDESGAIRITGPGGTLRTTAEFTLYHDIVLDAAGTVSTDANVNTIMYGYVRGAGSLTKTGAGTLTLLGGNTYGGDTFLNEGTLTLFGSDALSTGRLFASDDTTITYGGYNIGNAVQISGNVRANMELGTATQSGVVSGSGGLTKIGAGNLRLSGTNTYTGTTTLVGGTLTVTSANALGTTDGGTIVQDGATLALSGLGLVVREDITLSGAGVGGGGALRVDDGFVFVDGQITLADAATIASNASLIIRGGISGDSDLTLAGGTIIVGSDLAIGSRSLIVNAGLVSLQNDNSFTGDVTVNGGTLQLGVGGSDSTYDTIGDAARLTVNAGSTVNLAQAGETIGSLAGSGEVTAYGGDPTIGGDRRLTVGGDNSSTTFSGTLTEQSNSTLSLTVTGTGALTLTGANTYTGGTDVLAGTLYVNGDQSAATGLTSVAGGATLGGSGIIGGDVTLADGATLNPGNSPGTLTINGNLSLSGGSILNFEFGEAGVAGGALNDLVNVGGDLVLDGTLNVTTSLGGTFGAGVYRVFNYSGSLTDNGLELGTMPGSDVVLQTSVANQVNLVNTGGASLSFWDGASGANNGTIDGGAGLWQSGAGNSNWTDANGTFNGAYDAGTFAIFQGTGGTVTVDTSLGAVTASGLQFVTDGYVIDGDTLTLAGGSQAAIRVGDGTAGGAGVTATIAADITGAVQLIKTDLGTLVLSGDNSYTGGTRLDVGTLVLGSNNALGTGVLTTAGDTTLGLADGVSIANAIALGGDTRIDLAGTSTLSGVISGTGALIRTGNGTLVLTGANTYTGTTAVLGGTLVLGADDVLSDETAVTVRDATIDLLGNSDTVATFQLIDGTLAGSGTLTALEYQLENAQVDANLGAGTLFQTGGTSVLGGTSAAEIVAIDAGTLRLGGDERLVDGASVRVAEDATFDLAGASETIAALYGAGAVDLGAGRLTLGGTGLDSGFGGTLTGSGTLSKTGSGVFTLLGDHGNWTGTLEVRGGTLQFVGSSGGSALISGGMLSGNSTFASTLTMTGGTISPGVADAPIGTISAQAINLTGGTALFDFRSPAFGGLSDMLVASGAITISGTEVVVSSTDPRSSFPDVHRYTIVQGGSLTGTFANGDTFQQMDSDPHLFWRLRYDLVENGVALEVRRTVDFGANLTPGTTPNQIAVATTLSNGQLEIGDAFSDAILPLGNLPVAAQLHAFDSMGGENLTNATTGAFIEGQRFADLLTQRIYTKALVRTDGQAPTQARALAPVRSGEADALASPDIASFSMWVQGFGGDTRLDGDAATRNLRSDASGLAGGIEVRYGLFKAGIAGGYSQGSYDVRSLQASMQGETVHVGGYLGYEGEAAFAGLFGAYQQSDFDSTRLVTAANTSALTAQAKIDMTGRTFGGFAGYRASLGGNLALTPMVGVTNIRIERDGFDETGADPLNLLVSNETREVTYGTAQLRLSTTTQLGGGTFEPYLAGGVERYWGNLRAVSEMRFAGAAGDMGAFQIIGAPLEETVGVIGAGFDVRPTDRFEIGAGAGARVGNRVTQASVEMHARIRF